MTTEKPSHPHPSSPPSAIVWASAEDGKLWPAQLQPHASSQRLQADDVSIQFFGSDTRATVSRGSVKPYDCPETRQLKRQSRAKAFTAAVHKADAEFHRRNNNIEDMTSELPRKRSKRVAQASATPGSSKLKAESDDLPDVAMRSRAPRHPIVDSAESEEEDDDDEAQEEEPGDDSDAASDISDYEAQRLRNIQRNAELLTMLNLQPASTEVLATPSEQEREKQRHQKKASKPKKKSPSLPMRPRSRRLQGLDVEGNPLPLAETTAAQTAAAEREWTPPEGDIDALQGPLDDELEDETKATRQWVLDTIKGYGHLKTKVGACSSSKLRRLRLKESAVAKVVPERIFSIAFLPMADRILVMAGDKTGHVGIFDPRLETDNATVSFRPHVRPVSSIHVNPHNTQEIYTSAYEGVVRCWRPDKGVFAEQLVFGEDDAMLSYVDIDFDKKSIYGCHSDGVLSISDLRARSASGSHRLTLHDRKVSHCHVNPCDSNYIATSSLDKTVCVWDVRTLSASKRKCQPVTEGSHGLSISSVYFSPKTGNRLLTTGHDDRIKVWTNVTSKLICEQNIVHNNNTGRWLTNFKAVWDPKCEDYFAVGLMGRPRAIQIFDSTTGANILNCSAEAMNSVTSLHAFHPTLNALAGGNSSGRVCVWFDGEMQQ
eukprot:m.43234 g.43234  ORF g.43234 m.43234 type:complete len:657 (-) comp12012_c0_seq2:40-2010(-)